MASNLDLSSSPGTSALLLFGVFITMVGLFASNEALDVLLDLLSKTFFILLYSVPREYTIRIMSYAIDSI